MSQFEFIFVLVSIVLALSLTRLLDGLGQVIQNRSKHQGIDTVHLAFSIAVVILLVIVWWALFRWDNDSAWSYPRYLVIVLHMASFYALSIVLYPGREAGVPDFEQIRSSFYVVFAANTLLEILHTFLLGALFTPWYYLVITGCLAVLCIIGLVVQRRRADFLIGWSFVAVFGIWPFVARFTI
jgi:hypothetical protein